MVVILLLVPSSSSASLTTPTYTTSVSSTPTKYHLTSSYAPPRPPLPTNYHYGSRPYTAHQSKFSTPPDAKRNYSREYVNHVTRINISNDYPQIDGGSVEPDAVVKEGKQTFVRTKVSRKHCWWTSPTAISLCSHNIWPPRRHAIQVKKIHNDYAIVNRKITTSGSSQQWSHEQWT